MANHIGGPDRIGECRCGGHEFPDWGNVERETEPTCRHDRIKGTAVSNVDQELPKPRHLYRNIQYRDKGRDAVETYLPNRPVSHGNAYGDGTAWALHHDLCDGLAQRDLTATDRPFADPDD